MSELSDQELNNDREQSVETLSNLAGNSKSPHLKRQLLKAACEMLEKEIFAADFARLTNSAT
ncbi:hypothetical protein OAF74_02590 [bacterium]|jgi:hypothetical protein|nr:hypothetical protein [Planctomicrobium sp.]MDB4731705.1 hypothetical protein [bacterium]